MKQLNILIVLLLPVLQEAYGQQFPDFKPLRYNEDYGFLQKDTAKDWYRSTKYIPLSPGVDGNSYISFGGDIRYQYFYIKNESFGDDPKDADGYVLSRLLVHSDMHLGKQFRTFIQLQGSMAGGRPSASPVEDNSMEVHQAFADLCTRSEAPVKLTFRIGRQELAYGSQRLVSTREGPNNRQAFDAAKLISTWKRGQADLFYSNYVAARPGLFDDKFNKNTRFWGGYVALKGLPVLKNIDVYYLGLWRKVAVFDNAAGKETRHSVGTRLFGNPGSWHYDAEAVYQFGSVGTQHIAAWTASLNAAYELSKWPLKPEVGLKTELISGDRNANDNTLQTFNPLFPRGAYFGLAAVIGPANLFDVHPSVSFSILPKLNWNIDYDLFWRYSTIDGIYGPNTALITSGKLASDRHIGNQLSTDLEFIPNPFLYVRAEFTWLKAGDYLKQVSTGKDILFAGITAQLKF
jgi:hypothetical protein